MAPTSPSRTTRRATKVSGLTLTRASTGMRDGDSGILADMSNDGGTMQNLLVTNQYDGVFLRNTGMSWLQHSVIAKSARNGIHFTSFGEAGAGAAAQYFVHDTLVALNGAWGVHISPYEGHVCVEDWDGLLSFGNALGGVKALSVDPGLTSNANGTPAMYFGIDVVTVNVRASIVNTSAGAGITSGAASFQATASLVMTAGSSRARDPPRPPWRSSRAPRASRPTTSATTWGRSRSRSAAESRRTSSRRTRTRARSARCLFGKWLLSRRRHPGELEADPQQ